MICKNIFKRVILVIFFSLSVFAALAAEEKGSDKNARPPEVQQESDQQINDFSIAGYGQRGKKSWDLAGKTADIFDNLVKLKVVTGNLYGDKEDVKLTAERGDFNKVENKIHLEKDVVITTTSGAKLTTDSLDWDRKNDLVSTPDIVHIYKDTMVTTAKGALGEMALNKVRLEKEVKVEISPQPEKGALSAKPKQAIGGERIIITCEGVLAIDYEKNLATFNKNVKVDRQDSQIYCDKMDVYFNRQADNAAQKEDKSTGMMSGSKIDKMVASGNVKIVKGENVSYSDKATYLASEGRVLLTGSPRIILYSTEGMSASFGN